MIGINLRYFLFLTLSFCFNTFGQENIDFEEALKLGIEKSNIELVKKVLTAFKLGKKNKKRFLYLANERTSYRKTMLSLALLGKISGSDKDKKDNKGLYATLALLASIGTLYYSALKESVGGIVLSGLGMIIIAAILEVEDQQSHKEIYQDSIEIKDLIAKA